MSSRNEYFIFLKSTDSLNYYPFNAPQSFTVQLPETINLGDNVWFCTLRSLTCELTAPKALYVYCDLVEQSYVLDRKLPIIQYIPKYKEGRVIESYDSSVRFKVTRSAVASITVYVKDDQFQNPSFTNEPLTCTLHLVKGES